ncbi:OadG family protein [Massilicoli timonensis]|uniref:OadG family protein n=1 Tax=Massilicoli timonensis TaxID=2015901 RepID=UPI000C8587EB|nr:OadG family protein [Massilicoli timonensis]
MYGNEITLLDSGVITVFSMALVFVALIVISYFIDFVAFLINRGTKKEEPKAAAAPIVEEVIEEEDDSELVAVIAAAVAATSGKSMNAFVVRSIVPSAENESEWAKAGRMNLMR